MDCIWGDNESMINSPTVPESKLRKRHNILLFHYVRSMLSQGFHHAGNTASMFPDETLEVDASIVKGTHIWE